MKNIVYYVATSLDGFIAGPEEDISGFVGEGNGVTQYLADLKDFETVIMGRRTYEFGYKYGLEPGKPAYPHMDHFIFSKTLKLENPDPKVKVVDPDLKEIENIRNQSKTDIYLCGGGVFAGWLLENEQIDILKIKLNPLIQGEGISLFENSSKMFRLQLMDTELYEGGLQIMTYKIQY